MLTGISRRFLAPFYVANLLGIAAYLLLRQLAWRTVAPEGRQRGYLQSLEQQWYWEKRVLWMLLALGAGRFFRRSTVDAYVSEMLGYLKLSALILLGAVDARLGLWLLICYTLIFLLFTQPRYTGPQQVDLLTPASLKNQVLSSSGPLWFVMFTAPWSSACSQGQATFAELSLEYSSDKLRFGEMDVGRWPKVAAQFDVSLQSIPHQLPAFLLFKQGKLVKRIPKTGDSWEHKGRLRDRLLLEFDLDMMLATGLNT